MVIGEHDKMTAVQVWSKFPDGLHDGKTFFCCGVVSFCFCERTAGVCNDVAGVSFFLLNENSSQTESTSVGVELYGCGTIEVA